MSQSLKMSQMSQITQFKQFTQTCKRHTKMGQKML